MTALIYKRICKNPDCSITFSTTIHNQYYCSEACRKTMRRKHQRNMYAKITKIYKCKECGEYFRSKTRSITCSEQCADIRRKRLKTDKDCEKCRYYNKTDEIHCNYYFETGKLRNPKDYYPCEVFEPKRGVLDE